MTTSCLGSHRCQGIFASDNRCSTQGRGVDLVNQRHRLNKPSCAGRRHVEWWGTIFGQVSLILLTRNQRWDEKERGAFLHRGLHVYPQGRVYQMHTDHREISSKFRSWCSKARLGPESSHFYKAPGELLLAVQWLRLCLPMQGVWVRFLESDLRSQVPHGQRTKA